MGRYVGAYVATGIGISRKKHSSLDLKENYERIMKEVEKKINTSIYNIEVREDYISLDIKREYFEDNIHSIVRRFNEKIDIPCDGIFSNYRRLDLSEEEFNKEKFPILIKDGEGLNESEYIEVEGKYWPIDGDFYACNEYWLFEDKELYSELSSSACGATIWMDSNKIDIECDAPLVSVLNKAIRISDDDYLKTVIFYIFG